MQQTKQEELQIFMPVNPETGKGMVLSMRVAPNDPSDVEMAAYLNEIAATGPATIQELFIRLNDLIKKK